MADTKAPADMTDDELDEAIASPAPAEEGEPVEPETPTPSDEPEEPEEPEEVPETPEPVQPEDTPEATNPTEEPPQLSRRQQLAIQKIMGQRPAPQKQQVQTPQDALDYAKSLDADPEVVQQLEADRTKASQAAYNQGLEQVASIQFHTRLEVDAPRVMAKYPQLDPDSQEFNPVLADAVNEMYLSSVGYDPQTDTVQNPSTRYANYVSAIFELGDEIAGAKTETTRKNITKQAATTGIRPDGSKTKRLNLNQAPETMSDEELEAVIAQAIPKR